MLNDFIKKHDIYLILFILTVILSFGFFLADSSMGIDDEMLDWYGSFPSMIAAGRLGRIVQWVIGYEYIPFFYDFITIILYSAAVLLSADCFMRYINGFSKKHACAFACAAVSFPFSAFVFAFIDTAFTIGVSLLAAAAGTYLFCRYLYEDKSVKNLILSILCLIFTVSLYETGIIYFLISIFFIIIKRNEQPLKEALKSFGAALFSVYAYLFILKAVKIAAHSGYDRSSEFVKYDFSSLGNFINSFFNGVNELINAFIQTLNVNFGSFSILAGALIFAAYISAVSIKRKSILTGILGAAVILLPLGAFFITGNGSMPYRVYMPFGYMTAIALSLLIDFKPEKKAVSYLAAAFIIFAVLNQAKEINRYFYTENLKFQEDLAFARFIMHDLGALGLDKKPAVFAGKRDEIKLKYNYDFEITGAAISIFSWDKYGVPENELFVRRGFKFMQHHGLNIIPFSEFSQENIEKIKKEIPKMPAYPQNGYIKDMGEFAVIKIGPSDFDL